MQSVLEDLGGTVGRLGLDAQPLHRGRVVIDIVALVQVQGAGELLDIDDVGQVGIGEAQDAEGTAGRGVPADVERYDLQLHIGQLGGLHLRDSPGLRRSLLEVDPL